MHSNVLSNVRGLVLAGGSGTRLRNVIHHLPKVMALVYGQPFLYWVVRYLALQGIAEIAISTGYMSHVVENYIDGLKIGSTKIYCVPETRPLGTGGAIASVIGKAATKSDAWLVWNGDSIILTSIAQFYSYCIEKEAMAGIIGVQMEDASRFGTLGMDVNGNLQRFSEKQPGSGTVNAGVYLFRDTEFFDDYRVSPASLENDVFPAMIRAGLLVQVLPVTAPFIDIGVPEALALAESFIRRHFPAHVAHPRSTLLES